jgi:hypothetical protein
VGRAADIWDPNPPLPAALPRLPRTTVPSSTGLLLWMLVPRRLRQLQLVGCPRSGYAQPPASPDAQAKFEVRAARQLPHSHPPSSRAQPPTETFDYRHPRPRNRVAASAGSTLLPW